MAVVASAVGGPRPSHGSVRRPTPPVTNSVLSGRAGDQLGAGRRSAIGSDCRFLSRIGRIAHKTSWSRKAFTGIELADNDASWQRLSPVGVKAGERIRTADVQLGKLAQRQFNYSQEKALRKAIRLGDQLGAARPKDKDSAPPQPGGTTVWEGPYDWYTSTRPKWTILTAVTPLPRRPEASASRQARSRLRRLRDAVLCPLCPSAPVQRKAAHLSFSAPYSNEINRLDRHGGSRPSCPTRFPPAHLLPERSLVRCSGLLSHYYRCHGAG